MMFLFLSGNIVCSFEQGNDKIPHPISLSDISRYLQKFQYKPQEYNQKVYIIKPNLAIGLAVDSLEMKEFLIEFRLQYSNYDQITLDYLKGVLDRYDKQKLAQTALIICLVEKIDSGFEEHIIA